ncbi:hypothetical protein ABVT39_006244 [Epinephelus coioides]
MAPLTSPSCVTCTRLAEKVTELEGRISTLYQIRDAELLMDTIVFSSAQPESTCAGVSGTSVAASPPQSESSAPAHSPASATKATVAASPPQPEATAAATPPDTNLDVAWKRQGAKPKALGFSTPSEPESWSLVAA